MSKIPSTNNFVVAALYQFIVIDDVQNWQKKLHLCCLDYRLVGTLLIAEEGLNGTISGRYNDVGQFMAWLENETIFNHIECKYAVHEKPPFQRMKVRIKNEIVTMGRADIKPSEQAGTYVEPKDWNRLISDPQVMVIDTRNDYEIAIGQFAGAIDPKTKTFRQFPDIAEAIANLPEQDRPKKLAMYCTGGIRCEKSTSLMKQLGFSDVYHLKGGILRYLEEIPEADSLWEGECFVFDSRVAVDHKLNKGRYELCHACKMPLDKNDMNAKTYCPGISCPHCFDKTTDQQKSRFAERVRQIELSAKKGEMHFGSKRPGTQS